MPSTTEHNAETSDISSRIRETPIAIVGMACLMPDARSVPEFWENILQKVDSVTDVPQDRWDTNAYYDGDPFVPDKVYSKRGAFIPSIEFNPMEWGLPPNILQATDTNQLLSLVVAKDCLEDAGVSADSQHDRNRIGIVLGVGGGQKISAPLVARMQYPLVEHVLRKHGLPPDEIAKIVDLYKLQFPKWEENSFPGSLGNVVAGRIANRLNLGGINAVTDAACASSLSALRMAVHELLEGHSDLMITGGACTDNSVLMYMSFSKTPAFTRDDKSRPFDRDSAGMLVGEGIGMIALKRLRDAERDGDRVYAVVRGVGASSDGRFKSIYAPRPEGQAVALRRAYQDAGYEPSSVTLIEAHGTGTLAGDVAEVQGLGQVFERRGDEPHVALGSIKSQIGHLKAAAGIAGLIKVALALHHKVLPPTINVDEPNPKLKLESTPFYLNTEARPWLTSEGGAPRRAGVSAFGFGGTNFHVALEEHTNEARDAYRMNAPGHAFLLHADGALALAASVEKLVEELDVVSNRYDFAKIAQRHSVRPIDHARARVGFVATSASEAIDLLKSLLRAMKADKSMPGWDSVKGLWYRARGEALEGKVAALFPGQGSQYVGMGNDLACNFPLARTAMRAVDTAACARALGPVSARVYPKPVFDHQAKDDQEATLRRTEWAQPAIGAMSCGAFAVARAAGFAPDFAAGHSFGELTALWAAGAVDDNTFGTLAVARGQAMKSLDGADGGAMVAVVGDVGALAAHLTAFPDVSIANHNSPRQVVIGGPSAQIHACKELLENKGYQLFSLPVSAAFHTPLVEHAREPFAEALDAAVFAPTRIPVYANTTGRRHPDDPAQVRSTLKQHILQPVRFCDQIEAMYADGARVFVEFGPKNVLTKLVSEILAKRPHLAIAINPSPKRSADLQLRATLTRLAVLGLPLKDIDPSLSPRTAPHTFDKSPLKIELTAANYLSPELAANRVEQLADTKPGSSASAPTNGKDAAASTLSSDSRKKLSGLLPLPAAQAARTSVPPPRIAADVATKATETAMIKSIHKTVPDQPASGSTFHTDHNAGRTPPQLADFLSRFCDWEQQALRTHEQYLQTPREHTSGFFGTLQKQLDVVAAAPASNVSSAFQQCLDSFNQYQTEALRVHAAVLGQQSEAARAALSLLAQSQGSVSDGYLEDGLHTPLSQPTRAEVSHPRRLGSLAVSVAPTVPPARREPSVPHESVTTASQASVASLASSAAEVSVSDVAPALCTSDGAESLQHDALEGADVTAAPAGVAEKLQTMMLCVVAEKTGYPKEMLQLSMDMESDLGIDSIKRVEILATIQERFPEMPDLDPMELVELRTLAEVADYVGRVLAADPSLLKLAETSGPELTAASAPVRAAETPPSTPAEIHDSNGKSVLDLEKKNPAGTHGQLAASFA